MAARLYEEIIFLNYYCSFGSSAEVYAHGCDSIRVQCGQMFFFEYEFGHGSREASLYTLAILVFMQSVGVFARRKWSLPAHAG